MASTLALAPLREAAAATRLPSCCYAVSARPTSAAVPVSWAPAQVPFDRLSASDIARCEGLLVLRNVVAPGVSAAALAEVGALLDEVAAQPELGARANQAYTKNMVHDMCKRRGVEVPAQLLTQCVGVVHEHRYTRTRTTRAAADPTWTPSG